MRFLLLTFTLFLSLITAQDAPSKIYWNSLATAVNVGVPLADDESLRGGRVQIQVSFDQGKTFSDLGNPSIIEKGDIDDLKDVSISSDLFESMAGFKEGGEARFVAKIWDKAGNNMLGEVSDSILTIDETIPLIDLLEVLSSNNLNSNLANSTDSITFTLKTSEPIESPLFVINGDDYPAVGDGNTWMTVYPAEDADDGDIAFEVEFYDLAKNPGKVTTVTSNGSVITKDGTIPELDNIQLFTSNKYDSLLAVKGDTVFLEFKASEPIRDLNIILNLNQAIFIPKDSISFSYYHVFTELDTEGVIPITLEFNDMAGNLGELVDETTDNSKITYDMTPPSSFKVETVGSIFGGKHKQSKKSSTEIIEDLDEFTLFGIPELYTMIIAGIMGGFCLLVWASWFKIFSKAGQAGWKVFIPFFNIFVFTKVVQKPVWWIAIYLIIPIGYIMSALQISKLFGKKITFSIGLIILPFIFYPILAFGKSAVGELQLDPEPKKKSKSKKKAKKK
ncbi:MAG: hypothetical protein HN464_10590 [Candidatus Marinimicrobia bacterium]|nr:hypothetical protein [Candidatus Neomarinimicrobiota bacterium]